MKREVKEMVNSARAYFACYINARDMLDTTKAQEFRELSRGYFDVALKMACDKDKMEVLSLRKKLSI